MPHHLMTYTVYSDIYFNLITPVLLPFYLMHIWLYNDADNSTTIISKYYLKDPTVPAWLQLMTWIHKKKGPPSSDS